MQRAASRPVWVLATRGKAVRTTAVDKDVPCPLDRVNRQLKAARSNQLWVSDFTYVSTWQGFMYVAFVIDLFARGIVGWRVIGAMRTDFVPDALAQALYARQPERDGALVHRNILKDIKYFLTTNSFLPRRRIHYAKPHPCRFYLVTLK